MTGDGCTTADALYLPSHTHHHHPPLQAHPEDVTGDRCGICGRGDEYLSDWVCCDMCECWVHFSCDTRQSRGECTFSLHIVVLRCVLRVLGAVLV